LGTGLSSHPTPKLLTLDNQVEALHQVVQAVRTGVVTGAPVSRVILVGHSLGSILAAADQVRYPADADGLILTGYSHMNNPVGIGALLSTSLWSAQLDSRFSADGLPLGYFTTVPGIRPVLFYAPLTADPTVQAVDEELKETTAHAIEAVGFGLGSGTVGTLSIAVPVLVAAGELDLFVCGLPTCMAHEPAFYQGAAGKVTAISIPATGHNLNLSYSAPNFYTQATTWATRWIGTAAP
ncbi:MAG: alpha/beta hydrolase, partial [Glaciimonas sp.]|nr:alpha/beta hydrolase [Glaciimonas sp.]